MANLEPGSSDDLTARLVEQLTRTNERLERLEAALRETSLLSSLRHEPEHFGMGAPPQASSTADMAPAADAAASTAREAEEHFRRGVAFCQAGKFDEAIAAWQEVLKLQPENPYALANTGIVYTEQARWPQAREMFVRALKTQPDNAEAHYGLGMAEAQMGNYAGAIAAWETTLHLQPNNADARYNLALVRQRLAGENNAPPLPSVTGSAPSTGAPVPVGATSGSTFVHASGPRRDKATQAGSVNGTKTNGTARSHDAAETAVAAEEPQRSQPERVEEERVLLGPAPPVRRAGGWRAVAIGTAVVGLAGILTYAGLNWRQTQQNSVRDPNTRTTPSAAASGGKALASIASKSADPTPTVTVEADPPVIIQGSPSEQTPTGPARPGRMQIRLGKGVTGALKYWYVSRSDRAARMKPLPYPSRNGIIALPIPAEYNHPGAQLRVMNVSQGKVARVSVLDVSQRTLLVSPNVGSNLLQNADFTQGTQGWHLETNGPGRAAMRIQDGLSAPPGVPGKEVHFDVTAIGSQGWNVQCYQSGVDLTDGQAYMVSCWARSNRSHPLHVDVILDKEDWHKVGVTASVNLTPEWRKYLFPFTANRSLPHHSRVSFVLGEAVGPVEIAGITLRRKTGANTAVPTNASTAITISPGDFN